MSDLHPLAAEYLRDLKRRSRLLPSARRKEIRADIEAHLSEAVRPDASDEEARAVLDRMGDPIEIVDGLRSRPVQVNMAGRTWAALLFLVVGSAVFLAFSWIIGVILLWKSVFLTVREKWIGTLLTPGAMLAYRIWSVDTLDSGWDKLEFAATLLAMLVAYAVAGYLAYLVIKRGRAVAAPSA